ncbi:MAG: internal scaffolding protein [Microvirus sp.]|nr:MAG: internal scaffolding protein [Microvirus sp.]
MHKESMLYCEDPSLTIQSFAEGTKIENIMAAYENTGLWSDKPLNPLVSISDDVCIYDDFRSVQEALLGARASFDALDYDVRKRVGFNPQNLLAFIDDPANREECIKLGIFHVPVTPPAVTEPSVSAGALTPLVPPITV